MPDNPTGQLTASTGIGTLRWRLALYRRDQAPGANSGIAEQLVLLATIQGDVQPTYPSTFYAAAQVETPVTHLIRVRWLDYIETVSVVVRYTSRPNDGTIRAELFRVRRIKELAGRKRFAEIEAELERIATAADWLTPPDQLPYFAENPPVAAP